MDTTTTSIRWEEVPCSPAAGDPFWRDRGDDIGDALAEDAGAVCINWRRLNSETGYLQRDGGTAFYFPASGVIAAEEGGDWQWYYGLAGMDLEPGDRRDQLVGAALELFANEGWNSDNDGA